MNAPDIREKFLKYFEDRGHTRFPSASLVPTDPGVLLTMAGMLPFKPYFLGTEHAPSPRITSVQKCVRTSDIEHVGNTARHHTFFEMLGNFSFGDYFKREAIQWAFEWLTKEVGLDTSRLSMAVFREDEEAYGIWSEELGIGKERIFRLDEDNNFWSAGPTGPCGPCSEIYWDLGKEFGCGKPTCGPGCDCDRFLEIWNLVFMEYNRDSAGKLEPLPKKNVDTGMGLERIASVLRGVRSNFETDLFMPLIEWVRGASSNTPDEKKRIRAERIIVDHVRAAVFLLGDGVTPANDGRGYILRRLIRRAVDQGERLGISKKPFLPDLARTVFALGKAAYPDVLLHQHLIEQYLQSEEVKFRETLEDGEYVIKKFSDRGRRSGNITVSGADAVGIFSTYGIPLEIVQEKFQELGLNVKMDEVPRALELEKEKSRKGGVGKRVAPPPQGKHPPSQFVGYETIEVENARVVDVLEPGPWLVLERTPFYPEGGGQIGDTGIIEHAGGIARILDTQGNMAGTIYHRLENSSGIAVGSTVHGRVDRARRERIRNHHSATHLLHQALKLVLGDHAKQAGSLVAPDRLRFDFSHPAAIPKDVLQEVEDLVNEKIQEGLKGHPEVVPFKKAVEEGAVAMFGEKYGDQVRMVTFNNFSKELCGGTHVHNTREIGPVKITGETAVAAGMRRIEAVAGPAVADYYSDRMAEGTAGLQKLRDKLEILQARTGKKITIRSTTGAIFSEKDKQNSIAEWEGELRALMDEKQETQRAVEMVEGEVLAKEIHEALGEMEKKMRVISQESLCPVVGATLSPHSPDVLRSCADFGRDKIGSGGVLIQSGDNRFNITLAFTKDWVEKGLHAGRILGQLVQGKGRGGGRPELAQGTSRELVSVDELARLIQQSVQK